MFIMGDRLGIIALTSDTWNTFYKCICISHRKIIYYFFYTNRKTLTDVLLNSIIFPFQIDCIVQPRYMRKLTWCSTNEAVKSIHATVTQNGLPRNL